MFIGAVFSEYLFSSCSMACRAEAKFCVSSGLASLIHEFSFAFNEVTRLLPPGVILYTKQIASNLADI